MKVNLAVLGLLMVNIVHGDMFLHNPRGSNNRLNGNKAARANANRLFDSQNNDNGGYNVGDRFASASGSNQAYQYNMGYFQSGKDYKTSDGLTGKSLLTIEWTNQHGCSDKDLNCNFVIQYKCQEEKKNSPFNAHSMRNGGTTATPLYGKRAYPSRSVKDSTLNSHARSFVYGLHEPWEWYDKCAKRERNKGLFLADQNLKGKSTSIYTRQNAAGTRYGYECPEERDYYPYWHPSDWIDIAVLTDDLSFCSYYRNESFNVKTRGECLEYYSGGKDFKHVSAYSNKHECQENNRGVWVEFSNYLELYPQAQSEAECKKQSTKGKRLIWAIPYRSEDIDNLKMEGNNIKSLQRCLVALDPPECLKTSHSRTNHLGNVAGVIPQRYTWVLPHFPSGNVQRCVLRARYNISTGDYPSFKTFSDQNENVYNGVHSPVKNNPTIKIGHVQFPLQLAINTAQFGRVFQDRSYIFEIRPRPRTASNKDVIYNLNVRGKRGNTVQAYPAVEYDFIPKRLNIEFGSLVHIQWTGSNSNPAGNAGQGKAQTDRSNMVEMKDPSVNYPLQSGESLSLFKNAEILWSYSIKTKTKEDLILSMATSGYYDSITFCQASPTSNKMLDALLNNAPASYPGVLLRFAPGTYYYMCTRNNNFSNRNQKGRIHVYTKGNGILNGTQSDALKRLL